MNIYLHELRTMRRSTLIWAGVMLALAALYLLLFPGIAKDAAGFKELLKNYPPQVQAMMGVSIDSVTTLPGFYSIVMSFVALCGAIEGMHLGASVLSREARMRTADFLLVKPVSRTRIVTAKVCASLTMLLACSLCFFAGALLLALCVKQSPLNLRVFVLLSLTLPFLQLLFFALGLAVSVFFQKLRAVLPITLGTVFAFYLLGAFIPVNQYKGMRYLLPFQYFDNQYIIQNGALEPRFLIIGAAAATAAVVIAYAVYIRKDIHAAG